MSKGAVQRANPDVILVHWCNLIESLQASSLDFYQRLEQVIVDRRIPGLEKGRIEWREGGVLSAKRQYQRLLRERTVIDICAAPFGTGFFVSWRLGELRLKLNVLGLLIVVGAVVGTAAWALDEYGYKLRRYSDLVLLGLGVICGLFLLLVWLMRSAVGRGFADLDALFLRTPILAGFYERFFRPITYYRIDLALMYQEAVHDALMQVIDELTDTQSLPRLTEAERKPVLRDFYKR